MRAESAPASMLPAVCLAVLLLAAAGVQHIDAAAPAACTATPKCNLSQCPCYAKQIDGSKYARPAGCVPSSTTTTCRYGDTQLPEPGEYVPQQIHVMPATQDLSSFYIVWATGHVTEASPDLPTTTNPYNVNPLNKSAPGDALSYVWISSYQPSVGPAGANTVPSGRGGALIKADPATANAVYTAYTTNDYSSPVIHTVTVPNLQEGSTYYYKVGDPTKPNGVSPVFHFKVPCTAVSNRYPFRLGCIADVGQTFNSSTTLQRLLADTPGAVLLAGDLTYADDYNELDRYGYQPRWDTWGRLTQSVFANIPLITTIGNHEEEMELEFGDDYTQTTGCAYPGLMGGNGGDCARAFLHRYPTPYLSSGSTTPFWYAVDVGPTHIIMLSNYNPTCNPSSPMSRSCPNGGSGVFEADQYKWLAAHLAEYSRTTQPWLVVGFHEPYYSSQGTYQLGTYFKQNLEALFYQYGVDIVITGHVHAYERSYPVFNGTVDECAPVYFVVGDAGNEEGPDSYTITDPVWSAFRESSFGHGLMDFMNDTTAVWNWQRNQDPAASKTSDTVVITRATATNTKCVNRGYGMRTV